MHTKQLSDETDLVQLGYSTDTKFNSYDNVINPQYSSWTTFPTDEDPFSLYKYASVEVNLNKDLAMINRQTYSMLDWLGDCGGLLEALFFISDMFFAPFMMFKVR